MSTLVQAVLVPTVISASGVASPAARVVRFHCAEPVARDALRSSIGCERKHTSHLLTAVLPQTTISH
jgi:hypothetical protein